MRPLSPPRRLALATALVLLAVTSLYLGFDAASPQGGGWWRALSDLLSPGNPPGQSVWQPGEGGIATADASAENVAITALTNDSSATSRSALPYFWTTAEGVGGDGIHRAVRRKGVWFPVFSPGADRDDADAESAEKAAVPLYITSGTPPRVPVDTALNYVFEAIGGRPPYRWRMVLGVEGFSIEPGSGIFTGRSATPLETALAIHVTDAEGAEDSALYTLRIGTEEGLEITTTALPNGTPGSDYAATLKAAGGTPPYAWSVDDPLPDGLTLDAASGLLSGRIATAYEQEIQVRVSDRAGAESARLFDLRFAALIEITTPARLPPAAPGAPSELGFEASGGQPPYQWRLIAGSLPSGPAGLWELSPGGVLSGVAATGDSLHRFTLEVVDSSGNSAQKAFQLPVRNALLVMPGLQKAGLAWRPREIARSLGIQPRAFTITRSLTADGAAPRVVYQGGSNNAVDHGLATGATYFYTLHVHAGAGAPVPFATSAVTLLPFTKARGVPGRLADPYADSVRLFRPLAESGHGAGFAPENVLGPPDGRGTFAPASDPAQVLSLHARAGPPGASLDAHGGVIVLAFEDNLVWDGPGEDFTVFENVFFINGDANRRYMEPAIVSVALFEDEWHRFPIDVVPPATTSSTPATMDPFYYNRGFAGRNATTGGDPTDPRQSGGDSFDLADLRRSGLTWIRFVKIQSTGHQVLRDDFGGHPVQHTDTLGALNGSGSSGFDLDAVSAVNY